jgi:hypothetical protein
VFHLLLHFCHKAVWPNHIPLRYVHIFHWTEGAEKGDKQLDLLINQSSYTISAIKPNGRTGYHHMQLVAYMQEFESKSMGSDSIDLKLPE